MEKKEISSKITKSKSNKQKISSIIFVRAICSLGIVIFHYFCYAKGNYRFLLETANSTTGLMLVTSFFSISGTVLYYNYNKIDSFKQFYYKRWKSILPSYYICNFYFYTSISLVTKRLIYKGPFNRLLFNLIGLDGYLQCYGIRCFNLVGEWFLGAIILIYILYPLLSLIMNINIFIINYIIFINYYLMYKTNIYDNIVKERNIFTCINSFYFGMIALKYKKFFFESKIVFIFSVILLLFLCLFKLNTSFVLIRQIQGFSFYIVLAQIGSFIISKKYSKFFYTISNLSYSIFLYQHRIIRDILGIYNPTKPILHFISLCITFTIIFICSKVHSIILNCILMSKIFEILDSFFLTK